MKFRTHNIFPGRQPWPPEPERKGTVLLIALIVLSSVIISSVGLGMLIVNSLQQTRVLDSSAIAFYAAESGIERAIWEVRKGGDGLDAPLPKSIPDPDEPITSPEKVDMHNGAFWTRTVSAEEDEINLSIGNYGFYELQLLDPEEQIGDLTNWTAESGNSDIDYLTVTWDWNGAEPCDLEGECPVLFAEWLRWSVSDLESDLFNPLLPGKMTFSKRYMPGGETARIPPLETGFPDSLSIPDYAYRIRLRAEYSDLRNVVVKAHDSTGDQVPLPGRVKIDAWGNYAGIDQRLTVKIPRKAPLSSLFDFAVFSECSLVKGYPISCP